MTWSIRGVSFWVTNKRRSLMGQKWLLQRRRQITVGLKCMHRSYTGLEGGSRIWTCSLLMSVSSRRIAWSLSTRTASQPHDCPRIKNKKIMVRHRCPFQRKSSLHQSMNSTLDTTLPELVIRRLRSSAETLSVQSSSSRRPYPAKWVLRSLAFCLRPTTHWSKIEIKKDQRAADSLQDKL